MSDDRSKRTGLFIIGTVLMTLGAAVTTFATFFVYFYRIPIIVFLIGVILIWLSGKTVRTKVFLTLAPIVVFFIYQYFWRLKNTAEPETFLIPASFRGKVYILFNEPCGQEPKYENGRRVYEIPDNGILITKFKDKYGFVDQEYLFVDSLGKRTLLPKKYVSDFNEERTIEKTLNEPSRDSLGIFQMSIGGREYPDGGEFYFQEFYVSTYRQLTDTFGLKYDSKSDSIAYKLLKDCRKIGVK